MATWEHKSNNNKVGLLASRMIEFNIILYKGLYNDSWALEINHLLSSISLIYLAYIVACSHSHFNFSWFHILRGRFYLPIIITKTNTAFLGVHVKVIELLEFLLREVERVVFFRISVHLYNNNLFLP